jgi:hypothetical protein
VRHEARVEPETETICLYHCRSQPNWSDARAANRICRIAETCNKKITGQDIVIAEGFVVTGVNERGVMVAEVIWPDVLEADDSDTLIRVV